MFLIRVIFLCANEFLVGKDCAEQVTSDKEMPKVMFIWTPPSPHYHYILLVLLIL